MAVPTSLSDLSTTASSNPPSGATSIGSEGIDDHFRAGYAFIAQLNANKLAAASPTITGHPTIEGVTSTGATGTGNFVFSASPSLTGTVTTTSGNTSIPALVAKHTGTLPTLEAGTMAVVAGDLGGTGYYTRLAILGSGAAVLDFGTDTDSSVGSIRYLHDTDVLEFITQATRIVQIDGTSTRPYHDNARTLGGPSNRWSTVYAATGTINTSDSRLKTNVADSVLGLDFINSLRPVSYRWIVGGNTVNGETVTPQTGARTHWGFLAQEVKAAVDVAGVDFGGWVLSDVNDATSTQALRYDELIAPLVKAVQELTARVAALEGA